MIKSLGNFVAILTCTFLFIACNSSRKVSVSVSVGKETKTVSSKKKYPDGHFESKVKIKNPVSPVTIDTKNITPDEVISFAKTLIGIPYVYGSCDKNKGFDCSGFIWYVFNHFDIKVPRISIDYTNAGIEVKAKDSRRGDLILFTGSDKNSGKVGHLGMVIENSHNGFRFIHSASGGGKGVSITGMNSYFYDRFVKVIRIFK